MTTYLITAATVEDKPTDLAYAYGDLDVVAYHARKLKEVLVEGVEYAAKIYTTDGVQGAETGVLASVTGDADTVNYVLAKRLRAVRAGTADA